MLSDHDSMQIVKASIGLAQALDMEVVAEGVESDEELTKLIDMKCDYAQGYCFTKPVPLAEAIEYLKQH
jgi:EAL domain-containing protein (putative c-di-GMP-specific phosphodiesterase class I)